MTNEYIPIIELRIRCMEQQMVHAFAERVEELKPYVEKAVSEALSPNNIQEVISKQVNEVISHCIKESLGGYAVRQQLEKIITNDLLSRLKTNSENSTN